MPYERLPRSGGRAGRRRLLRGAPAPRLGPPPSPPPAQAPARAPRPALTCRSRNVLSGVSGGAGLLRVERGAALADFLYIALRTAAPYPVGPRRACVPVAQLHMSPSSAAPEARLLRGRGEVVFAAHCDSDAIAARCASSHKPARRSGSRCTLHECRQARRLRRCLSDRVCCCPCCAVRATPAACGRAPRDAGRLCNAGCYWLVAS